MRVIFLFSLPIQILICSRDTLTDTPRNNVLPTIWTSLSLVKLIHKLNHQATYKHMPLNYIFEMKLLKGYYATERDKLERERVTCSLTSTGTDLENSKPSLAGAVIPKSKLLPDSHSICLGFYRPLLPARSSFGS